MSSHPHTSSHQRPAELRRGGIELSTLFAAGVAAVVAAYVVSKIWAPGTVWATAFTPILVSLVKEALERPAQKVGAVATRAVATPRPRDQSGPPPPVVVDHEELTERKVYGTASRNLPRRWKLAVVTGLIAFVSVVALYTVPELVAGNSVTSGSSHTTFFGGHGTTSPSSTTKTDTTKTQTTTVTKTTTTPAQTTPTTSTTTPAQTAPAPTTTTPPPAATPPPTTPAPSTPAPATP